MAVYYVENSWAGTSGHDGGAFVLGARDSKPQYVVAIDIKSNDGGASFQGTMTYEGEGPIGFRAKNVTGNTYTVENQWGGNSAPWHPGGQWLIGGRDQKCVALQVKGKGKNLEGTMTYEGEGPIGFIGTMAEGNAYVTENSWGGTSGHPGGVWVIGCRGNQHVVDINVDSKNNGQNLDGQMTYSGEGHIGLKATLRGDNAGNNYNTENSWGGSGGHNGGKWVIGTRGNKQGVVSLEVTSSDDGKTFEGKMTYYGEGPIGVTGKMI